MIEEEKEFFIRLYHKLQKILCFYQPYKTQQNISLPQLPQQPWKNITYQKILSLIPLHSDSLNTSFTIQILISDILKKPLNLIPETTGPMIFNLQRVYQNSLKLSQPTEISQWLLIHLSCLCKRLGQKQIGALRFYQWKQKIETIIDHHNQNNLEWKSLIGDQVEVKSVLKTISGYKIHYSQYEDSITRLFKLDQLKKIKNEKQKLEELKLCLMIIASLLAPQNTYMLFGKLTMMDMKAIQELSKTLTKNHFRYDVSKPDKISSLLRKKKSDNKIKYFEISFGLSLEETNKPIDETIYLNELYLLSKEEKRTKLLTFTNLLEDHQYPYKKGDAYLQYLMEDPDEFIIKDSIENVYSILYKETVWIVTQQDIDKKQYKNYFDIEVFQNIRELQKAYGETQKNLILILPSNSNIKQHLNDTLIHYLPERSVSTSIHQTLGQQLSKLKVSKIRKKTYDTPNFELMTGNPNKFHQKLKLMNWMLRPQNLKEAAQDFAYYCQEIQRIEQQFFHQDIEDLVEEVKNLKLFKDIFYAVKIYSTNYFSKIINMATRKLNQSKHLAYIRYPFASLYHAVLELCYEQRNQDFRKKQFNCYRGCNLTHLEIKNFKKNIGEYFTTEGFLSTSLSKTIAMNFIKNFHYNCLVCIKVPALKHWFSGFADISQHSQIPDEQEILFNPNNFFRVISAIDDHREPLTIIELEYVTIKNEFPYLLPYFNQWKDKNKKEWLLRSQKYQLNTQLKTIRNQGDLNESLPQYYQSMLLHRIKKYKQNQTQSVENQFKILIEEVKSLKIQLPTVLMESFHSDKKEEVDKLGLTIQQLLAAITLCSDSASFLMLYIIREGDLAPSKKIQLFREYQKYLYAKICILHLFKRNYFIEAGFIIKRIAEIYFQEGQFQEAEECLEECICYADRAYSCNGNFQLYNAYLMLGTIYANQGRDDLALQIYEHCIDINSRLFNGLNPQYVGFMWQIAKILLSKGEFIKAQKQYEDSLKYIKTIEGKQKLYRQSLQQLCQIYQHIYHENKIETTFLELIELYLDDLQIEKLLEFGIQWWQRMRNSFRRRNKVLETTFCECLIMKIQSLGEQEQVGLQRIVSSQETKLDQDLMLKFKQGQFFDFVNYFLQKIILGSRRPDLLLGQRQETKIVKK